MKKIMCAVLMVCGCGVVKPEPKITETAEYKGHVDCADNKMRLYDAIADVLKKHSELSVEAAVDLCIGQMHPKCPMCGKPYKNLSGDLWCDVHFSIESDGKYFESIRATTKNHDVYLQADRHIEYIKTMAELFKVQTSR